MIKITDALQQNISYLNSLPDKIFLLIDFPNPIIDSDPI